MIDYQKLKTRDQILEQIRIVTNDRLKLELRIADLHKDLGIAKVIMQESGNALDVLYFNLKKIIN